MAKVLGATVALGCGFALATEDGLVVSQKGRKFAPTSISVGKGQTIIIFNDDDELLHHAYVESDTFNFDSGDQKPGSRTKLAFPVSGTFTVLCGIHPKMKLKVQVR